MIRHLIALAALLSSVGAIASDTSPKPDQPAAKAMEGTWDFRIDGTTIFRYTLAKDTDDDNWHGTWQRPARFRTDGNSFARLMGGVVTLQSTAGYRFMDAVELSFADNRPGAVPDVFHFVQKGKNSLVMTYEGTDLAPYTLVRAKPGEQIGNWDPTRTYSRNPVPPTPEVDQTPDAADARTVHDASGQTYQIVTLPGPWRRAAPPPKSPSASEAPAASEDKAPAGEPAAAESAPAPAAVSTPEPVAAASPVPGDTKGEAAAKAKATPDATEDNAKDNRPRITPDFLDGI